MLLGGFEQDRSDGIWTFGAVFSLINYLVSKLSAEASNSRLIPRYQYVLQPSKRCCCRLRLRRTHGAARQCSCESCEMRTCGVSASWLTVRDCGLSVGLLFPSS